MAEAAKAVVMLVAALPPLPPPRVLRVALVAGLVARLVD